MNKEQLVGFVKRHGRVVTAASAAGIFLVSFGAFALLPRTVAPPVTTEAVRFTPPKPGLNDSTAQPPRMVESGTPFSFADLVERVSPAVVSVTADELETVNDDGPEDMPEGFRQFFKQFNQGPLQPQVRKAVSMGSGFVIDRSGLIVTNNHVIEGAKKVKVKLPDGRTFDAKVMGTDPATDVALLKVNTDKPLPTVEFGNDRQVRVGDWVVAVGNPFGLSNTVTAGIVSSIGRNLNNTDQPYTDFIQIDAPINRGNSGGPTFDLSGQVIGMNSMIFSPTGGSVGIGFAIPASTIKEVVAQLEEHGHVARGWLGVQIQSLTPEMAASLGIAQPKGVIVASVVPNGPAARAGFLQGDVITAINGRPVEDQHDLTRRVASLAAGRPASITVLRDGAGKTLQVTIGQRKDEQVASNESPGIPADVAGATGHAMGLALAQVTPELRRSFNLADGVQGVVVTKVDPESDAADKGLQPGDVLLTVGNKSVRTPQEVEQSVAAAHSAGRKSVLLLVSSDGTSHFVAVEIAKT